MKRLKQLIFAFGMSVFALGVLSLAPQRISAQTATPTPVPTSTQPRLVITSEQGIAPVIPSMLEPIITGGLLDGVLVKNKPLSAVLDSRTARPPGSGSAANRRIITKIYRDSQGRTRREQIVYLNDAAPAPNDVAQSISIYDPIARYGYSLDPATHIASRHKLPPGLLPSVVLNNQTPLLTTIRRDDGTPDGTTAVYTLAAPQVQSLGAQTIAGVPATGWRMTVRIPAGALGNQNAAETVYEGWFSTDLQMLVKCSVTSQLGGEQTLLLTSINRAEPAGALFQVPAGYTISEMGVVRTDLPPPR